MKKLIAAALVSVMALGAFTTLQPMPINAGEITPSSTAPRRSFEFETFFDFELLPPVTTDDNSAGTVELGNGLRIHL